MPTIPEVARREYVPYSQLPLVARGKVRDTYALDDKSKLLPVATDRVSIFDFVLPAEVPQKGEVLAAMNAFWIRQLRDAGFSQDAVQFGRSVDAYLPPDMQGNPAIQKRGIVVRKLKMIPVEAIVRGYLTGSGWTAYGATAPNHFLCGHRLPAGLKDGDRLPEPIFTPTTKAEEGHDEHMDANFVRERHGNVIEELSIRLFNLASQIALAQGIVLADTKMEFGRDPSLAENAAVMPRLILGDERFTPDSSRFWLLDDWKRSRSKGASPISFDKQFVREWGKTVGVHTRDPLVPEDVAYVHSLTVPQSVLLATRQLYRYIFYLLTGKRLETFQRDDMGILVAPLPVEVIVGSASDLEQIGKGLDELREKNVPLRVHVVSCHRNPDDLRRYAETTVPSDATIIAAAGKAAALPGVLSAWLRFYGKAHIPVIGVALKGKNRTEDDAATLSIEQLPGNPVVLNEDKGAFFGSDGFHAACVSAMTKDFFVPLSVPKEARFDLALTQGAKA